MNHRGKPGGALMDSWRLRAWTKASSKRQNFIEIGGDSDFIVGEITQPSAVGLHGLEKDSHDLFQSDPLHLRGLSHSVFWIEQFESWFRGGGSHDVPFHEQVGMWGGADRPDRCSLNRPADGNDLRTSSDGAKFFAREMTSSIKVQE